MFDTDLDPRVRGGRGARARPEDALRGGARRARSATTRPGAARAIGTAHDWESRRRTTLGCSEWHVPRQNAGPLRVATTTGRKHKDSGGQRYEDTLFFNRLRTHAKWVFVLLIIVFGGGFVFLGVGSGEGCGLERLFNGIRGGGGSPAIDKPLKRPQKNPKDAQAWKDLATAYDAKADYASALPAWQQYTQLRPKDADGLTRYTQDLPAAAPDPGTEAQNLQLAAQQYQPTTFGPPATSPLGRALGSLPTRSARRPATSATTSFRTRSSRSSRPRRSSWPPTRAGQAAAGRAQRPAPARAGGRDRRRRATAIAAYEQFIKLAPDDASAPQAKPQSRRCRLKPRLVSRLDSRAARQQLREEGTT